jgi:hypothetical protein
MAGERVLGTVSVTPGTADERTDDRGEFRLFGLPPGSYVVSAVPADEGLGLAEVPSGGTAGFVPVYFPATTVAADAQPIVVKMSEEVTGVNIRLQLVRTVRIEGRISAPSGTQPGDVHVTLVAKASAPGSGSPTTVLRSLGVVARDWTFSYAGVAPGTYQLTARVIETSGVKPSPGLVAVGVGQTRLWARTEVVIDGRDERDLNLVLQPGVTVTGVVRLEPGPGTAVPDLSRVRVSLLSPIRSGSIPYASPAATPDATGRFVIRGVIPGPYHVSASVSGAFDWSVRSSVAEGRDTLDVPLDVRADEETSSVMVTVSNVTQRLSGMLQDAGGRPAPAFTIVVYPADPALRRVTRRIRTARPGVDGRYTIDRLPAGEYRVAAVYDITPADTADPAFLEQLTADSLPLVIRPGERKVQNFQIAR